MIVIVYVLNLIMQKADAPARMYINTNTHGRCAQKQRCIFGGFLNHKQVSHTAQAGRVRFELIMVAKSSW